MTPDGRIIVGVGDCRIARLPTPTIATYALGSCIAVIAYDWRRKTGGLLHVMLPDSSLDPKKAAINPYVYADTGVPALLREMDSMGSPKTQLRWSLAGGARMMADSSHFAIGKRNHMALKKIFWQLGMFVEHEDIGGEESRSVWLDLRTGRIDLRKGTSVEQVLARGVLSFEKGNAGDASLTR